ncbi:subtilase family AB5 toxin binding subunit, partial [Escherichia coli]
VFHTIVSIKNDGHYFCRAGGNRPDGLNEPVTFYTTGQLVRIYYEPGVWTYPPFVKALTSNALVGLSTCATSTECFGPDRKKN